MGVPLFDNHHLTTEPAVLLINGDCDVESLGETGVLAVTILFHER